MAENSEVELGVTYPMQVPTGDESLDAEMKMTPLERVGDPSLDAQDERLAQGDRLALRMGW